VRGRELENSVQAEEKNGTSVLGKRARSVGDAELKKLGIRSILSEWERGGLLACVWIRCRSGDMPDLCDASWTARWGRRGSAGFCGGCGDCGTLGTGEAFEDVEGLWRGYLGYLGVGSFGN